MSIIPSDFPRAEREWPRVEPRWSRRAFLRGVASAAVVGAGAAEAALPQTALAQQGGVSAGEAAAELGRSLEGGAKAAALRRHFMLDPAVTHLNTGSLGASPRAVVEAHARYLAEIEANPVHLLFGSMGERMEEVRRQAAAYLGANLDEVLLTANTTSGMNLVAAALRLQRGDEVVLTNHEHPGGRVCWEAEATRTGVVLREFDVNPVQSVADILRALAAAVTERTKVISVSHVSTINGLRMPIAHIAGFARERGLSLVVDGAQSAGMLDIDLHALGCDAYATSGHKWMLAPKGTGILYLRKEFQARLSHVLLRDGPHAYTAASGTRNVPQILAQGAALRFLNDAGPQRIEKHALQLAGEVRRQLGAIEGVIVTGPAAPELQSAIVTVQLPAHGRGPAKGPLTGAGVSQTLFERHGIVVKAVPAEHLQGRGVRVSTHLYNSTRDVELLAQGLREVIETS